MFKPMLIALAAIIFLPALCLGVVPLLLNINRFLSINRPVDADVLIVEGWLFDYMLDAAVKEFNSHNYRYILTVGFDTTATTPDYGKTAEKAAEKLRTRGIDFASIFVAPCRNVRVHKTYNYAVSAKKWLMQNDPKITAVNVFTAGTHGRKTYTLYKRALGKRYAVGILSCEIKHYNPQRWWLSRRGLYVTSIFGFGYLYALVWPFPKKKPE